MMEMDLADDGVVKLLIEFADIIWSLVERGKDRNAFLASGLKIFECNDA